MIPAKPPGSVALMTAGSGLSAVATAVSLLVFSPVLTGVGVGPMVVLTRDRVADARGAPLLAAALITGFRPAHASPELA